MHFMGYRVGMGLQQQQPPCRTQLQPLQLQSLPTGRGQDGGDAAAAEPSAPPASAVAGAIAGTGTGAGAGAGAGTGVPSLLQLFGADPERLEDALQAVMLGKVREDPWVGRSPLARTAT